MTRTVAVVPLRGGTVGKTRLARVLGSADRVALVVGLARHVVATLGAADGVAEVLVVSAEPGFAREALAGVPGPVRVVPQPPDRAGLNAALDVGREHLTARARAPGPGTRPTGPTRLLVAHADLPALAVDDVAALLASAAPVTMAGDRLGTGTNALVLAPAGLPFTFRFGPGSLAAHRAEASRRGCEATVVHRPGTAVDLDTPEDWAALPAVVRRRLVAEMPALGRLGGS